MVFRAGAALARRVPRLVSEALAERLGLEVPVVLRTAAELRDVIDGNPFPAATAEPKTLHVAFLAAAPAPARVRELDPDRSPPDRFVVRGRDVFLHLPNGAARSKLTNAWFDAQLGTRSTMRNWRTVLKLVAMTEGISSG